MKSSPSLSLAVAAAAVALALPSSHAQTSRGHSAPAAGQSAEMAPPGVDHGTVPVLRAEVPPVDSSSSTDAMVAPAQVDGAPACTPAPRLWRASTTGPGARYRAASATDGNFVYVFGGGTSAGTMLNDFFRWDPATETWAALASMPTAKQNIHGAYWNGKIYAIGGFITGSTHTTENAIYDMATNTWSLGAPLPLAQSGATVAHNGKIYNFGGNPNTTATTIYDIATNTWSAGANMPVGLTYGRAVAVGAYAYYIGGIAGSATVNTVYRYHFASNTWATMAPMQTARATPEVMRSADGAKIFAVMGGGPGSSFFTGVPLAESTEIYDIASNSWSYGEPVVVQASSPAGGLVRGKVVVQGGVDGTVYYDTAQAATTICATCPQIPGAWGNSTLGPPARYRGGSATDGRYVYIFGGGTSTATYLNDLWRWDPLANSWTQLANMPTGKQNIQGAYWNGKIYVPGGFTGTHTTENAIYDIASNIWTTGAPLPAAQTGTNVAYNGKIYNFGGNPLTTSTTIYDIATNTWSAGAAMPTGITYGRAVAVGGYAYYIGGIAGTATVNTVYRYHFASNTWTTMAPMQTARTSAEVMASPDGSKIYAVMGGGPGTAYFTGVAQAVSVEIYDIAANTWSYGNPIVTKAAAPSGGLARGKLMVHGGVDGATYLNAVQTATLPPCPPALLGAVSRKMHGAGVFDIPLPLSGPMGVECRSSTGALINNHQVIATFDNAVTIGGFSVVTTGGIATVSATTQSSTVTINLSSVTDAQRLHITLLNVSDGVNTGDVIIPMAVLLGDTNGNGTVNTTDISQVKSQSGVGLSAGNFRTDVVSNGSINASDISAVKSRSGSTLPP